jgi:hypothetical protein
MPGDDCPIGKETGGVGMDFGKISSGEALGGVVFVALFFDEMDG